MNSYLAESFNGISVGDLMLIVPTAAALHEMKYFGSGLGMVTRIRVRKANTEIILANEDTPFFTIQWFPDGVTEEYRYFQVKVWKQHFQGFEAAI